MLQHGFGNVLWLMPTALQAVIVIAMLVRGLYRELPYFFIYTTNIVVQGVVLLWVMAKYHGLYFYAYWFGELISWALGIAVIYEIYSTLLREYPVLQKVGAILFWVMGIALVLIG